MYTPSTAVLRFSLFLFAISLYLFLRFVWPARLPLWSKALLTVFVFSGATYPMLTEAFWGGFVASNSPRWAGIWMNFHSGVLTLLTIVTLLRDVALLACWVVRRFTWQDVRRVSGSRRTALTLLTASAGLAFVGVVEGTRVPDVVHRSVTLPELPPEWEGFRIAHLSDIHVSSIFRREHFEELVARTNALKADLVLITGDFVDGRVPVRYVDAEPLAKLTAPYGVWGCEGNHEHYSGLDERLGVDVANRHTPTIPVPKSGSKSSRSSGSGFFATNTRCCSETGSPSRSWDLPTAWPDASGARRPICERPSPASPRGFRTFFSCTVRAKPAVGPRRIPRRFCSSRVTRTADRFSG